MVAMKELVLIFLMLLVYTSDCISLQSMARHNRISVGAVLPAADVEVPSDWSQYLSDKEKEYLIQRKREEVLNLKHCRPVLTVLSTYTHQRGTQTPNTIMTSRCQGGTNNPENYQCQPSKMVIECFHTRNEQGLDDYLGIYSHEACEERCVCGRKSCKDKQLFNLICPKGFKEDKSTCQCMSSVGESIFYRSLGIIADWDMNLHRLCRSQSKLHKTNVGESFKLKVV